MISRANAWRVIATAIASITISAASREIALATEVDLFLRVGGGAIVVLLALAFAWIVWVDPGRNKKQ